MENTAPANPDSIATVAAWLNARQPGPYDGEQQLLEHRTISTFKAKLKVMPSVVQFQARIPSQHALFGDSPSAAQALSWPLIAFKDESELPPIGELRSMCNYALTHVCPALALWEALPTLSCVRRRVEGLLALAAIGYIAKKDFSTAYVVWSLALRMLLANVSLDNRLTRSNDTVLIGLLIQSAGALSSSQEFWRLTNSTKGFVHGAAAKTWSSHTHPKDVEAWTVEQQSSLVLATVVTDIVRSLHFGTLPVAFTTFKHANLSPPYYSIAYLQSTVIFGEPDTLWPPDSERNGLIMIIVILNQTILWAKEDYVIAQQSMKSRSCNESTYALITSNPLQVQSTNVQTRIHRALFRWEETYSRSATPGARALFTFCQMYVLYPDLHHLPSLASYRLPRQGGSMSPGLEPGMMAGYRSTPSEEALHLAWCLADEIGDCSSICPLWYPVITYLAALVVWRSIKAQGRLKTRGSLRVLLIFRDTLSHMCWPCCGDMAQNLFQLSEVLQ